MMQLEAPLRFCHNCLWYYKFSQRLLSCSATHRSSASYYDVLGVKPDASVEEIKNAFFDKSKKLHPDSDPSNPSLHGQFVKLNEAYRVLSKEGTRKEYDFGLRHYQSFRPSSRYTHKPSSAETAENVHYWEQFRNTEDYSEAGWQKKKKKNLHLVGYCIIAMLLSIGAHYLGSESWRKYIMTSWTKRIVSSLKSTMSPKREPGVNGFKKQQEILRQKHAEFLERYKIRQSGKDK